MKKGLVVLILLAAFCSMALAGTPLVPPQNATPQQYAAWKASLAPRHHAHALDYADRMCNSLVCVQIGTDGLFNIGTTDGRTLLFYYPDDPWSSHIIVSVDGSRYELGGGGMCSGMATFDGWTDDGTSITENFSLLGYLSIQVIHTPTLFSATTGAILTRTIVTNNDPTGATHNIGVMYEYDTTVDGDDAAQLHLGPNYVTVETCYDAPFDYPYWDAVPASGTLVGRGTFTGGAAVTPDHLAFGSWPHLVGVCWNEACTGDPYGDSAVRYLWDEQPVGPSGGTRNVATYYGVGEITVTPGVLAIGVVPPGLECADNGVHPNPYQVVVDIQNNGGSTCSNINVQLGDGTGPGGSATVISTNPVNIASLDPGANQTVTFTVQGSFATAGGCINATVNVTSESCDPNSADFCTTVPECNPTGCNLPYTEVDMGSLNECYPTLLNNPGHALTGVAWLGPQITGEAGPHVESNDASRDCFGFGRDLPSLDPGTDGVAFFGAPWTPCTQVTVAVLVTAGPNYVAWADNPDHHLYLSAWKNGNYPNDSDFDDELCGGAASEWLIHDAIVTPSSIPYLFSFMDPGVFNHGIYRGVFRFRLGSHPFGRYGYGYNPNGFPGCPGNMANDINGGFDCVGEVEDYDMCDFQLAVELASFTATPGDRAVTMHWTTASESQNDHFEIMRDGVAVAQVRSQGQASTNQNYTYTDNGLANGTTYNYKLVAVDINGGRQELTTASATPAHGAGEVTDYALAQNFPNPFNPTTSISFDLKEKNFVTLKVYNMVGQEVATLVNGTMAQGRHSVSFDATNLPSGLYIYRMEAGSFSATKKMLLMK